MDSQFKKGVLELCVLGVIYNNDCYGYELIEWVSNIIEVSKGTLYPLLKRLQKEEFLEYYMVESMAGPSRKYYKITPKGVEHFKNQREEWSSISSSITNFLKGVGDGENE